MRLLLVLLLLPSVGYADCSKVSPVAAGDTVSCEGLLFPLDKARQATEDSKLKTILEQQNVLLKTQVDFSDKQLELVEEEVKLRQRTSDLWKTQAVSMTELYMESEYHRGSRDFIFLTAGVVITVLSGYALGQVNK